MNKLTMLSPAKINLMLRVLGRREDGYHELQTCFKRLPWGDKIDFQFDFNCLTPSIEISGFPDLPKEDNLIFKAAQVLLPYVTKPAAVHINVDKNIPEGGGLGGGSSNAATTLKVLNDVWGGQLSDVDLRRLGLKLGADVPFFLFEGDALASGVGEQLVPIELNTKHILLLFPECGIPTADVFRHERLTRNQTAVTAEEAQKPIHWINDCLAVVLDLYPQVNEVYRFMSEKGKVYLSGTGSTLFMLYDDYSSAMEAKKMAKTVCPCHLIVA